MDKCDICDIPLSGAMKWSHLTHCKKTNYKCQCGVVVRHTEKERHDLDFHTIKTCERCNEELTESHFCIYRLVNCIYCLEELEWVSLQDHETQCGCETVNCSVCNDIVVRKKLKTHIAIKHNINPSLKENREIVKDIMKSSIRGIVENKDDDIQSVINRSIREF